MTQMSNAHALRWETATGLAPLREAVRGDPQGMLVADDEAKRDRVAVVYHQGDTPPEITIETVASTVHTVKANGVAVAVIACANAPQISAEDVLLVERWI